ncbi:hypothetical protein CR983_00890 [Candidatus Saccharibacteria bacterium]|nr:MAG: hypothetical protein CR983_00890 [Candidatus Saccharibacteria bacterium]
MRPDDPKMKHPSLFVPQRPSAPPSNTRPSSDSQQAAADITRSQINRIYAGDTTTPAPAPSQPAQSKSASSSLPSDPPTRADEPNIADTVLAADQPDTEVAAPEPPHHIADQHQSFGQYDRRFADDEPNSTTDSWQEYHSAWQNYYQQYFQRYYNSHLQQTQAALHAEKTRADQLEASSRILTPEQAMDDLRSGLRGRIQASARKVRRSRHFTPIAAALVVMVIYLALQYGNVAMAYYTAYIRPGDVNPTNIIINPDIDIPITNESRLVIPKINVDVPAIYDKTMGKSQAETYKLQMNAMSRGVAWFGIPGASSRPGQTGNTVLSGHSSNLYGDTGQYKFIFAALERLTKGDVVYATYKGKLYTYSVTKTKIVEPDNLAALRGYDDKPTLTLITCTPLGTADKRLLVTAEQISPNPSGATKAPTQKTTEDASSIPGESSTFFDRIFGG